MYHCDLVSLFVILVTLIDQIGCQSSSYETCHVWGDPHLLMFPVHESQKDMRATYWCQSPGRMLILKNKFIEIYVDVTTKPFYNENYEIKLFAGPTTLCTITHNHPSCAHIFVNAQQIGGTLSIDYYDADLLNVIITSHLVKGRNVYNIMVTQSYQLISQSSGLCVTKQPTCRLESAANPFGRRRKRNLDLKSATYVCDEYMKQAYKTAQDVTGNKGSKMVEHARAACIDDVSMSGYPEWGQSAIQFVVMDALKQAQLTTSQRLKKLKIAVPAIVIASSIAGNVTIDREGVVGRISLNIST